MEDEWTQSQREHRLASTFGRNAVDAAQPLGRDRGLVVDEYAKRVKDLEVISHERPRANKAVARTWVNEDTSDLFTSNGGVPSSVYNWLVPAVGSTPPPVIAIGLIDAMAGMTVDHI